MRKRITNDPLRFSRWIGAHAAWLSEYIFPLRCLKCGDRITFSPPERMTPVPLTPTVLFRKYFCEACLETPYEPFAPPFCTKCGRKFETKNDRMHLCGTCQQDPSRIGKVRAAAWYDGIARESIQLLKYSGRRSLAAPLEMLLSGAFTRFFSAECPDVVVPLPLHISKLRKRGFNQSFLLVRRLKSLLRRQEKKAGDLRIDPRCLKRVKKTAAQTGLTAREREVNLKGAFEVVKPASVKDKRVLLVDDVYTTGATAREAAGAVLDAGAVAVDVLVAARA